MPLLEAIGITKRFPGVVALGGVSMHVAAGECLAIVEGYTRVPPDDELDALHDELARRSIAEEPW